MTDRWHGLKIAIRTLRLLLITLLAVGFLWGCIKGVKVGRYLVSVQGHWHVIEAMAARAPLGQLGTADLAALQKELEGTYADLAALRGEVEPLLPLCDHLGWVPRLGGDIKAAPHLLEIGLRLTRAGDMALTWLQPFALEGAGLVAPTSTDTTTREGLPETLMRALLAAEPDLLASQGELDRARHTLEEVDTTRLSPNIARVFARLDGLVFLMGSGTQAALLAPEALGASEPRTYLLLVQNEDELRSTGGFISGAGLLRLRSGKILELDFKDSYAVDDLTKPHSSPPEALGELMGAQMWLFRDANWSPDYPTAAGVAATIYEQDQGRSVSGVIAVDQRAIRSLVEVMGPIQMEGRDVPVTGGNFVQTIRRAWAPVEGDREDQWWLHRKDFMSDITTGLIEKLQREPDSMDFVKVAHALWRALAESHILVHLTDPALAEILAQSRWNGAILPAEGDFLMVVDTNVGFNKVNPNVQQALDYRLVIGEGGETTAVVSIAYKNTSHRSSGECIQESRYDATYEEGPYGLLSNDAI